jgi:hypothetical protein
MTFLNYLLADEHAETSGSSKDSSTTASADVVVEQEVVAYVWDFDSLKDFLAGEREVSNALAAYMNHDLRDKLASMNNSS